MPVLLSQIKKIMNVKMIFCLLFLIASQANHDQKSTTNPKTIKVLSFNILHGATTQGNFDLDKIANIILDADPDFVALQEVDFKTNRAKKYDLPTELGNRTGMASLFGRAMYYDGGEYGEGVLSKSTFLSG